MVSTRTKPSTNGKAPGPDPMPDYIAEIVALMGRDEAMR